MYARTVYIVEIEQLGYDVYIVQYKTRVAALNISAHGVYVHQSAVYIRKKKTRRTQLLKFNWTGSMTCVNVKE